MPICAVFSGDCASPAGGAINNRTPIAIMAVRFLLKVMLTVPFNLTSIQITSLTKGSLATLRFRAISSAPANDRLWADFAAVPLNVAHALRVYGGWNRRRYTPGLSP